MNPLIIQLSQLRQQLIDTVDKFPTEKREQKLFDQWSLKDIIAHLSGWDIFTTDCIKKFKLGKLAFWGGAVNKFNQQSIKARYGKTWSEIYIEFVNSSKEMIQEYDTLNPEVYNQKIWPDKSYTPEKFVKIDIDHYQEHLESIKKLL